MSTTEQVRAAIEAKSAELGLAPSTVGEMAGQGGHFYKRLVAGKRVWPETAASVLAKLEQMSSPSASSAPDGSLPPKNVSTPVNHFKGAAE